LGLDNFKAFIAYDDFAMRPLNDLFEQQFGGQIVEIVREKASKRIDC